MAPTLDSLPNPKPGLPRRGWSRVTTATILQTQIYEGDAKGVPPEPGLMPSRDHVVMVLDHPMVERRVLGIPANEGQHMLRAAA